MKPTTRTFLSLCVGIIGIISLFLEFSYHVAHSSFPIFSPVGRVIEHYLMYSSSPVLIVVGFWIGGAFIPVLLFSIFGFFLSIKNLRSKEWRKIDIFSLILNLVDLFFSITIAWLLFGLASGM